MSTSHNGPYVAGWNPPGKKRQETKTKARFDTFGQAIAYLRDAAQGYWDDEHDDACWMPLFTALDLAEQYGAGYFLHRIGDGTFEFWIQPDGEADLEVGRAER